jgi:hypothetical protein
LLLAFDVSLAKVTLETPAPHSEMYATMNVWDNVWLKLQKSNRWSSTGSESIKHHSKSADNKEGVAGGIPLPEDLK